MLQTVGFALVALLCFGVNDLIFRRASRLGATPHHIMMTLLLTMMPLLTMYGLLSGTLVLHPSALWGTLGAIFGYVAFYKFSAVLQSGAVSVAVPVFRLSFVVAAILAILFLGESLSTAKLAGLCCAVAAVWCLLGGAASKAEISSEAKLQIIIATVSAGIPFYLFKLGLNQGASAAAVLFGQTVGAAAIATAASCWIDRGFRPSAVSVRHGIAYGTINALGFGILVEAMARGEASILVPIAQLSFLVAVVVGMLWFKEQTSPRKLAGIGLAIAAVALLGVAAKQSLN